MEREKFFDNLQRMLDDLPPNFNILEEKIDINVQMEYFNYVENKRTKRISNEGFKSREELFLPGTMFERKKQILAALAYKDDPAAYRTIERFLAEVEAEPEIKQWAVLALQESRMLLQSSLLDEQQVFISTGLGGKDKKLRYFVVFFNLTGEILNKVQKKLLKDELGYRLEKESGEMEKIRFLKGFSTALVIVPLKSNLNNLFKSVLEECNQYGNFLKEDIVITNVKELTRKEILHLIETNREQGDYSDDDFDLFEDMD